MRVTVIGAGYVGLVVGACTSDTGNTVRLVDSDAARIDLLRSGGVPIYEPGLEELLRAGARAGRLTFTTDLVAAVADAQVVCLAVGTPGAADGRVDMTAMDAAATDVGRALRSYAVLVVKSTVPVGTCRRLTELIRRQTDVPFDYVANPEFLKEGSAVADFQKPDRVIVGATSDRAVRTMHQLYAPFMRRMDRMLVMDPLSAELAKYAANAMLATRISFMNELAELCERCGADIEQVRRALATDHRIGPDYLFASLGYGGSCLPKDVRALVHMGRDAGAPLGILQAVDQANARRRQAMLARIRRRFDGRLESRTFAMWGLAFKARTDDVRESPAVALAQALLREGASVVAHDPKAAANARSAVNGDGAFRCVDDMYAALQGADALIVCTEWQEYRTPDFDRIRAGLRGRVVFDGRNLYEPQWLTDAGLAHVSIGRPDAEAPPAGEGPQA